ncbi:unnamed protein product [Sphagnum troendelagicum]
MGGVGKTLLLREVYWSRKVRAHFQGATFIWLTVGQTPDLLSLYRSISDDMGSKPHEHSNMVDYKQKLESELVQKRVFLVLDDVWKDEDFDALDLGKGEGSVTLLTTRIESILQRPCISQEHMKTLSPEDSWSLFCVHAFGTSSSVPHRLEASAKSMAKECGGLPLALKVIGAAMFGKTSDEREWKPLLKKLNQSRMQERTMKNELYEHLKLGYDVLKEDDPRLEDCFTYFAAFPEDHEVEFEVLLWCWIGEGLVPGHVGDDPEIDAYDLLMKLRRRSLIESIAKLEDECDREWWYRFDWNWRKRYQYCHKTLADGELHEESHVFKVHDVMRDLAFYILQIDGGTTPAQQLALYQAGQNLTEFPAKWITECKQPLKAHRLSLHQNQLETLPSTFCAPELLTLLLVMAEFFIHEAEAKGVSLENISGLKVLTHLRFEGDNCQHVLLPDNLSALTKLEDLRLYHFHNLKTLPTWMPDLKKLRSLSVSWCDSFRRLPSSFTQCGAFPSLIEFKIEGCINLVKFPEVEGGAIPRLQTLSLNGCRSLQSLPLSLEVLTNLRNLHLQDCFLKGIRNLRVLDLSGGYFQYLPAELGNLKHLNIFTQTWVHGTQLWQSLLVMKLKQKEFPWKTYRGSRFSHTFVLKDIIINMCYCLTIYLHSQSLKS